MVGVLVEHLWLQVEEDMKGWNAFGLLEASETRMQSQKAPDTRKYFFLHVFSLHVSISFFNLLAY